ncbi:unnamed protein product [Durusdinium trenchii]|uniref:Uncharacterized protein n=1 Tax=Durusdinium trenchii TaxID=1381693 RepID=A0ABP0PTC4_9DINO
MRFWRNVRSHAQQQMLYEDFLKTKGKWRQGVVWREVVQRHRGVTRGVRKWLTRKQLIEHFVDEETADAVIARKHEIQDLAGTEIREHPELPGLEQYLVLVEDEEVQEDENLMTDMFKCKDEGSASESESANMKEAFEKDVGQALKKLSDARSVMQKALEVLDVKNTDITKYLPFWMLSLEGFNRARDFRRALKPPVELAVAYRDFRQRLKANQVQCGQDALNQMFLTMESSGRYLSPSCHDLEKMFTLVQHVPVESFKGLQTENVRDE